MLNTAQNIKVTLTFRDRDIALYNKLDMSMENDDTC